MTKLVRTGRADAADDKATADAAAIAAFDLSRHLPHLLRRAHFEAEAVFAAVYGADPTSRQLALLVTVAQAPDLSQVELGKRIGLDANTCSDLVARTVAKGLIRRTRSPDDARRWRLALTDAGRRVVAQRAVPRADAYVDAVAARLTDAERRRLVALLRRLLGLDTSDPAH